MKYDFKHLKAKTEEAKDWLRGEYSGIRASRATPALLDGIQGEVYGSRMPLNQIGNVSVLDARSLRVTPFDVSQVKEIERAVTNSGLGASVGADQNGVVVSFPELTSERREQLAKLVKSKLEEARISVRNVRDETWSDIQKKEKADELTEDDKYQGKEEMQEIVDKGNKELNEISERKLKEIEG
ncbi:MAG: ribosome recycling factor [Candidatus Paceibacterota bacterium]